VSDGRSSVIDRAKARRLRFDPATPGQTDFGGPLCAGIRSVGKELMAPADFGTDLTASEGWPDVLDRQDCVSACKTDPLVECAPRGGQIRRAEL